MGGQTWLQKKPSGLGDWSAKVDRQTGSPDSQANSQAQFVKGEVFTDFKRFWMGFKQFKSAFDPVK
jgi:hypothetical protein